MTDPRWRERAACATVDPELFFPDELNGWRPQEKAKRICATCPVQRECLADAPTWDTFSVRGGLTAVNRRRARKQVREVA
jgi:WhiB family redox-sensing transcriptional regulator